MSAVNLNHFRILEIEEKVQEPCYLPPSTLSTDTFSFPYPVQAKVQDPCYLPPPTLSTDTFSFPYPVLEKMQDPCYPPPSTETFSFPYPVLVNTPQNQGATGNLYQQQEAHKLLSISGSSDHPESSQIKENNNDNIVERSLANQYTRDQHVHGSSKYMDPKVLLMRKKMSPDQTTVSYPRKSMQTTQDSNRRGNSSSSRPTGGVIRVCSDCNTTKTPLWRSGPKGPKSLCNACGIRQRKARRAMAAPSEVKIEKITDGNRIVPFKKRCKFTAKKKLHLDGVAVGLSKDPSLHQVFPQDEKDAAILLMTLSCGLLHGRS